MTLPASGDISLNNVNTETGRSSGYSIDMDWVRGVAKTSIGGSTGVTDMDTLHDKAYYQNNTQGNCDNGNCTTGDANCGNIQCRNCYNTALDNCANCDTQSWLQPNCNCACTYNCNTNQASYNCNCACDCSIVCACACSDIKLKTDVAVIENALDKIDQLTGVMYNWNGLAGYYGKQPGQRTMGVIANKTQTVVPEVVGPYKDVLTVDYEALTGLIIEAVKELKTQVNDLKRKG